MIFCIEVSVNGGIAELSLDVIFRNRQPLTIFKGLSSLMSDCENISFVIRPEIASDLFVAIILSLNAPIVISVYIGLFCVSTMEVDGAIGRLCIFVMIFIPEKILLANVILAGPMI